MLHETQADTWAETPLATLAFSALLRWTTVSSLYYMYNIIIFLIQKMKYSIYIKKRKEKKMRGLDAFLCVHNQLYGAVWDAF